jgi:hypothetical protein
MEGRALDDAPGRKKCALEHPVGHDRLGGIVGACRVKPAAAVRPENDREDGRGRPLVDPDKADCGGRCDPRPAYGEGLGRRVMDLGEEAIRLQASANTRSSWMKGHLFTWERATSSRSQDRGRRFWCRRKISRILRLARFRRIAFPTACCRGDEAGPRRASPSRGNHQTVNALQSIRRPCSRTSRMSFCRRRCCPGRRSMGTAISGIKRPSAACGPSCGGRRELCGHPGWTCGRGIRSCGLVSCDGAEGGLHGFVAFKS